MKEKRIVLNNREQTEKLAALAEKVRGDISIEVPGGTKLDASSILGLFAVKFGSPMSVSYPESVEDFDDYLTTLELQSSAMRG